MSDDLIKDFIEFYDQEEECFTDKFIVEEIKNLIKELEERQ